MERCLLDTSALSDAIRPTGKLLPNVTKQIKQYLRAYGRLTFSEISCYEILRGFKKQNAIGRIDRFIEFCQYCELISIDFQILELSASIWADGQRQGIVIGDGDIIIAASAIRERVPLVTANPKHFRWISGLRLQNWRDA